MKPWHYCSTTTEEAAETLNQLRQGAVKSETDMISRYLNDNNISAKSYHGGMSSKERNYVQELFTSNKIRVLLEYIYLIVASYGWYFTFIQGFVYLFLIYLQGFTSKQMVNPWKTYVKLLAVLMGSHGLTKGSRAFLNCPAQIMFKSTKVNLSN
ncbi:hypothetical protein S245_013901 [Arachis hypogaea]